jgi:hypothetical protein
MCYEDFLKELLDESFNEPRVLSIELTMRILLDPEMD